ncbi:MAG: FkbM family methyltransferase [Pseudomonadota bacterium]
MGVADNLRSAVKSMLRPFTDVRGAGRVCGLVNRIFLACGATRTPTANMRDGTRMVVDVRTKTEWFAYYTGRYDDDVVDLIVRLLGNGGHFLDVGGNIGMYAVRVACRTPPNCQAWCFEPVPTNADRILCNAQINNVEQRVLIHRIALSDTNGSVKIVLREDFQTGSATGNASVEISDEIDGKFDTIEADMKPLDEVRAELSMPAIDVIKVDIEGHEDYFFRGASASIERDKPFIFTEINNYFYRNRNASTGGVFKDALPSEYGSFILNTKTSRFEAIAFENLDDLVGVHNVLLLPTSRADQLQQQLPEWSI